MLMIPGILLVVMISGSIWLLIRALVVDAAPRHDRWGTREFLVLTGDTPYRRTMAHEQRPRGAPVHIRLMGAFLGLTGLATLCILIPGGLLGLSTRYANGWLYVLIVSGFPLGLRLIGAAHHLVQRRKLTRVLRAVQHLVWHHFLALPIMALAINPRFHGRGEILFLGAASLLTAMLGMWALFYAYELVALESDGDALESDGDALESDGDALESDGDALESDGDALEGDGDALERDGDALESDGD